MRIRLLWLGIAVLVQGLIVTGAGAAYTNAILEGTGAGLSVVGLIYAASGAATKKNA